MTYLPAVEYRVFAVAETRTDRLWQSQNEALALPSRDVTASIENPPVLNLRMTLFDVTSPKLLNGIATHRQGMRLVFSEPVIGANAKVSALSQTGQTLSIIYRYQNPADSSALLLATAIQREGDRYQVRVDSVFDRAGNEADSLLIEVSASTKIDTLGPRLTWSQPATSETEVDPATPVRLGFSEAVTLTDLPRAVSLLDSSGSEVPVSWQYSYSAQCDLKPVAALVPGKPYKVILRGDSLHDVFGVVSPDSFSSINFRTSQEEEWGVISGRVTGAVANLRVLAEPLNPKARTGKVSVGETGDYRIDNLPGADYRLWLYQDRDRNQRWSPGSYSATDSFKFAEPITLAHDSVRVRSGWETENTNLEWLSGQR